MFSNVLKRISAHMNPWEEIEPNSSNRTHGRSVAILAQAILAQAILAQAILAQAILVLPTVFPCGASLFLLHHGAGDEVYSIAGEF